jgi:glycerol-3-phosphate acyltransferase PlsY
MLGMAELAAILLIGYLLGSLPTSIWLGKLYGGVDVRRHGSGNAGATNVIRLLGWKPGLFVLAVDLLKGYLAVAIVAGLALEPFSWGSEGALLLAGCSAVAGHIWSLFAGFRGGKGVATAAGVLLAVHPVAWLFCVVVFTVVVCATRLVSVASMTATASFPLVLLLLDWLRDQPYSRSMMAFALVVAALIIFAHRSNIANLIAGREPAFRGPRAR